MHRTARHPGFTLIELVLVLVLLTVVLATAAPSLARWGWGRELTNAGDDVMTAVRWARGRAISSGTPHRVEFDTRNGSFRVTHLVGQEWVEAPGEFAEPTELPERLRLEVRRHDDAGEIIDLLPNGRVSPVEVTITADWGPALVLASPGAAEPLRVVSREQP